MTSISPDDPAVAFIGALDLDRTATGWIPRRLPAWTRPQVPDVFMDIIVQMPSGVRLTFLSDTTSVVLDVKLTVLQRLEELKPATFDLVIDGKPAGSQSSAVGDRIIFTTVADLGFELGEPTTITFEGLPAGMKSLEVWLPHGSVVELRGIHLDDGATLTATPPSALRRWLHYGSSISHCLEAETPLGTWPVVAADLAGVELINLGLAGNCMLDPFVARTIRDERADVISLKVGINLVNGDTVRERSLGPMLHGFLDTVREKHPDTPILLVSPIYCPSAEDRPGPTTVNEAGQFVTTPGLEDLRATCLTLQKIRTTIETLVQTRTALGDPSLHYLDGLELFSEADLDDLPDHLHPNATGYRRMGGRFAAAAFGPGGALAG